jgi:hypothetical protein
LICYRRSQICLYLMLNEERGTSNFSYEEFCHLGYTAA